MIDGRGRSLRAVRWVGASTAPEADVVRGRIDRGEIPLPEAKQPDGAERPSPTSLEIDLIDVPSGSESLREGAQEDADGVGHAGGEGADAEGFEAAEEPMLIDGAAFHRPDRKEGGAGENAGGEEG